MCDYSLEYYHSRAAKHDDILVTKRFPSGTIGCVEADGDEDCAVCLKLGAKLKINDREAEFVHMEHGLHHDGVEFKDNGEKMNFQTLGAGVIVTVTLPLPVEITDALGVNPALVECIPAE